jgi:hypothetical protein
VTLLGLWLQKGAPGSLAIQVGKTNDNQPTVNAFWQTVLTWITIINDDVDDAVDSEWQGNWVGQGGDALDDIL